MPLKRPATRKGGRRGGIFISGGDQEACRPIGQIGKANFRPLPPIAPKCYGVLTSRTSSTIMVPLPTNPNAENDPLVVLPEVSMRACREIVWTPCGTFSATKSNDAAFNSEMIRLISSGVTQLSSSTMLKEPSAFVTMVRQPAIAPSSCAESV